MAKYLYLIISLFLLLSCNNSQTANKNKLTNLTKNQQMNLVKDSKQITKMEGTSFIKNFYDSCYRDDVLNQAEIYKKYVSSTLLNKIASVDVDKMDYDPFINGQDFSASSIKKSLKIDSISINTFDVYLKCFENDSLPSHIILKLETEPNHKIKILMIENNSILNHQ